MQYTYNNMMKTNIAKWLKYGKYYKKDYVQKIQNNQEKITIYFSNNLYPACRTA